MKQGNTICAVSTGTGITAISVIRISGAETFDICKKIFFTGGHKTINPETKKRVYYGIIKDKERIIDEVVLTLFHSPHSYTGEDIAEISCHGSPYIRQEILNLLVKHGAHIAKPGEFTQRAFMNGKLDLSQAEAIADLISSHSTASHRTAINQMRGGFSKKLRSLRDKLVEFTSLIELELDFSEEDVEFADRNTLLNLIKEIHQEISKLTTSFELGNAIKNGVPVVIIGRPNVGKSTLLNALLNEDRAIVSEIEGTTRDTIEDTLNMNGITFRFIDTAGLRVTKEKVELLGIKKTHENIQKASLILLLEDATANKEKIKETLQEVEKMIDKERQHLILLLNKSDKVKDNKNNFHNISVPFIQLSAKERINIDALTNLLSESINLSPISHDEVVVVNARHYNALQKAGLAIERVIEGINIELSGDLLAQDIREALHYLGEITGEVTTDEILSRVFANFCIGK